ncbi:signal peptidase [Thalassiosira pseudonana CCMP1335]|uniref:Signal peptidase n=1 Tax=Thalassiosira pseudonana TaxID=35128 RepID=B8LDR3_THAPS|nr:signal peptidase [Thalassiosira pseudonana CCMP1335]EED86484.1 signal peptidase [Thalassiosira pseudonana CCMP1335]
MTTHLKRSMLGFKLANVYDGSALGIMPAADAEQAKRAMLLIESGVRFHPTTHYSQSSSSSSSMPSAFAMKLRKHLRNLRLENVTQLGNLDRVVDFRFGSGSLTHHLLLELYSLGNLILCDGQYRILGLLRTHEYEDGGGDEGKGEEVKVRVGNIYPGKKKVNGKGGGKKKTIDESVALKALLLKPNSGVYHYGPSLIEHCITTAGVDPMVKLTHDNIEYTLPEASWNDLVSSLCGEGAKVIENLSSGESGGYILYKPKQTDDKNDYNKTLLEFQPHLLHQHKNQHALSYTTFATATDEFFSHLSSQRIAQRADAAEAAARERLSKIQLDQQRRVDGLVAEQEKSRDCARLVEMHAEDVDRVLGVINSALESGMNWDALEQLVLVEQGNENPIALLIFKLELCKDQVVLALPDIDDWDDSDPDRPPKLHYVTVSIKESAHGNARNMFATIKQSKTLEASTTALKAAEAKAKQQLAEAQKKKQRIQVMPNRKTYWFEKFAWFITSDNYLVVAGQDAQQNEQLVKKYLRPGDAYLHAEVHGAATCILRAKRRRRSDGKTQVIPLSDQALREAGTFTTCRSSAWSSKMVCSAYWVESHQVSKTAPTGEYLTVGSFMIRGRKNFLPPSSLEMGMGVLFRLGDDASVARHANERRDFALMEHEEIFARQDALREKNKVSVEVEDESEPIPLDSYEKEHDDVCPTGHTNAIDGNAGDEAIEDTENNVEVTPDAEESTEQPNSDNESSDGKQSDGDEVPTADTKKKQKELSRGKRSKNRRAKKKYSEQDAEDRELAMMALQGGESSKKKRNGKGSRDGKQRKTKAEKQAEKEAWQEILAEDGIIDDDGDDDGGAVDDTAELSKLTGKPSPDDVLLCAIPVCAPYQVLNQYKYRVKLTPGSVKRGKASKQCVELFLHNDDKKMIVDEGTKRDCALIKLINENEWVKTIIGDVRITSAGASKLTKKQKGGGGKGKSNK